MKLQNKEQQLNVNDKKHSTVTSTDIFTEDINRLQTDGGVAPEISHRPPQKQIRLEK